LNPEKKIASELFEKKIVMLGDYDHHNICPFHDVLSILKSWSVICSSITEPVTLTLVLEKPEEDIRELDTYIKTGVLDHFIDYYAADYYIEDFEYYMNLRNLSQEVDSLNSFRINNKITLNFAGFEPVGEANMEKVLGLTKEEFMLWQAHERDSIIAEGVKRYSESNPNSQILMVYGLAHLCGAQEYKGLIDTGGYHENCLALCLFKDFGRGNVLVLNPYYYYDGLLDSSGFKQLSDVEFMTDPNNLKNADWLGMQIDYFINIPNKIPFVNSIPHKMPSMALLQINSRFIIEKILAQLRMEEKYLPGFFAQRDYSRYLRSLEFHTGVKFKNSDELDEWIKSKNNWRWLSIDSILSRLIVEIDTTKDKHLINEVATRYGVSYDINDTNLSNYEQWKSTKLPTIINHIKFKNAIGLYFLGYPEEKLNAKEYLVQFSGQDFNEPLKYLQWYRRKFFNVDY